MYKKSRIKICVIALLLVSVVLSVSFITKFSNKAGANNIQYSMNNWMSNLPNTESLKDISIPGTHDSMTFYKNVDFPMLDQSNFVQTQDANLQEQFEQYGARWFDFRDYWSVFKKTIWTAHGPINLKMSLDSSFAELTNLLNKHNSEFAVLRILLERNLSDNFLFNHQISDYTQQVNSLMEKYKKSIFIMKTGDPIPTVEQLRGKIVIISCVGMPGKGSIKSNTPDPWLQYGTDYYGNNYNIEDTYNKDYNIKDILVENNILKANDPKSTTLTYSETNMAFSLWPPNIHYPLHYAKTIQPKIISYLENTHTLKCVGIVAIDYINMFDARLAKDVIDVNFNGL